MAATPKPNGDHILIYAELLTNLRQVTVKAALPSAVGSATSAAVRGGGREFVIKHHDLEQKIQLPARIAGDGPLPTPSSGSSDLIWRIPVAADELRGGHFVAEQQPLPWTATEIVPDTGVICRACNTEIVRKGSIKTWKDLPSEGWAELMDFWHCHKPVDHTEVKDDDHLTKRGYGASTTIRSQPGVGLVDMVSFMLSEADCTSLIYRTSTGDSFPTSADALSTDDSSKLLGVFCSGCQSEIGSYNVVNSSLNLFKWRLLCETKASKKDPSSPECLVAALTSTISRSGSAKSIVLPTIWTSREKEDEGQTKSLYLWILNYHLVLSSSRDPGIKTAIKVLYKDINTEEAITMTESLAADAQDMSFPESAVIEAREALIRSTASLPSSERRFQDWNVGLLPRWTNEAN